ncbi:MAG: hypothetical protein IAG10_26455 [Planctomycetaceae bacterium]|nr:hypothetical protein [Planctomycetaceae bacterium]
MIGDARSEIVPRRVSTKGTSVELVNDARLKELAREPVRDLFPAARRAAVMRPLVVLLAVLPGLLVFWNPSLDEATSQQGLRALDVGASKTVWDWIATASNEPSASLLSAKPLAILLTALGLKVKLLAPESRLLLTSYVSSVFLLFCLGGLAKKVGGIRFAMLVVLLACGHREFLALGHGLPPIALPLAFAVLSFRGMLAHQSSEGPWISWSLLGSGLALAACSLSGGELAFGAWCVLCVQSVLGCCEIASAGARTQLRRWIWRCLAHVATNFLGLLFVTSVCLVVVGGWQYAFSGGLDFREVAGLWPAVRGIWPTDSRGNLAAQFLLKISGLWLGFVLLGAMKLARDGQQGRDEGELRGRWFLMGWLGVAGASWWMTWSAHGGESMHSVGWPSFLLLSLLFLAAWGLEAVLLREFGLASVLTAVFVTIGVLSLPSWLSRLPSSVSSQSLMFGFLVATSAALVCTWSIRRVAETELRCRVTLVVCVTLLIVMDFADGLRSRPPLADDERELQAFRRQLVQDTPPSACWLVSEDPSPARLRFFLRSLWPGVEVREARGEELVSADPWTRPAAEPGRNAIPTESKGSFAIVVTWGSPRLPAEEWRRRGQMLTQSAAPHFFQGRPLKAYRWALRSSSTPVTKQ